MVTTVQDDELVVESWHPGRGVEVGRRWSGRRRGQRGMARARGDAPLGAWNGERGFGFVRPTDRSADLFVHLSSFGAMAYRPEVGDVVSYRPGKGKETVGPRPSTCTGPDGCARNRSARARAAWWSCWLLSLC